MRELYNEFFRISKHGKIREKVMLTRFSMTIITIIICLAAISFSAYAYFSHNITSSSNIIKSAKFETNVSIQIESSSKEAVEVRTSNNIFHVATLTGNKTYYITLKHTDRSTAQTGFIIITAKDCDDVYHTRQINRNEDGTTKTITFSLKPTADTEVTFDSRWGTSSYYSVFKDVIDNSDLYIQDGETIEMIVNETNSNSEEKSEDSDNTETAPPSQETPPASAETENTEHSSTEQDEKDTASESIAVEENPAENESSDIPTTEIEG